MEDKSNGWCHGSRLLPTLRFPVACDFICRSVPPKAQRHKGSVVPSFVNLSRTGVEVAKAKFSKVLGMLSLCSSGGRDGL